MDTYEFVDQHFPYDGPHSRDTVLDALGVISGLVRYVNNATRSKDALSWASTVYGAVNLLRATVSNLDQLTSQLVDALERLADDPTLYDDRRSAAYPARDTALASAALLLQAGGPIADLSRALNSAAEPLNHLGND